MMIQFITGNLLDAREKYMAHQTNCVSTRAAHLAASVFKRYPYADVYSTRETRDKPGTIKIMGNGNDERFIVNMFGQVFPGSPKLANFNREDTGKMREQYFYSCLKNISNIPSLESIAFPARIGCGAAGGNWQVYLDFLTRFEKFVSAKFGVLVTVYTLPE